jgi:DNA-binding MarR family transcriptional regulator
MTIEEAIKQKQFDNEIEKVFVNVIYTSNQLYFNHLQFLKAFGISPEQYNVLRILRGSHPKTMSLLDISSRMLDKSSNGTRLVEKLKLKKLITREVCEKDRRQVDILITEDGLGLLKKIDAELKIWFTNFNQLTEEDAKTLNGLLDKMRG